jgi:hypothetical protein
MKYGSAFRFGKSVNKNVFNILNSKINQQSNKFMCAAFNKINYIDRIKFLSALGSSSSLVKGGFSKTSLSSSNESALETYDAKLSLKKLLGLVYTNLLTNNIVGVMMMRSLVLRVEGIVKNID